MNTYLRFATITVVVAFVACAYGCSSDEPARTAPSGGGAVGVPTNIGGGGQTQGTEPTGNPTPPVETPSEQLVCDNGDNCSEGACLIGPSGGTECAKPCDGACPDGWSCKLVATKGEYPTPLCVFLPATQCNPCTSHDECNQSVDQE
ncbi:MAG: hypothetical protein VX938_02340, partial [Myxococcota bacterium]|nr:hypothetical protein [Myxococcota bacterium]